MAVKITHLKHTVGPGKTLKRIRLKSDVTLRGRDYFGRRAWIRFRPHNQTGWYWSAKAGGPLHPVTSKLVSAKTRRMFLTDGHAQVNVWEHIGSLRWTGLDGVIVECTSWPAHHGRPQEKWDALAPHLQTTQGNMPWVTPNERVRFELPKNPERFVEIKPLDPSEEPSLHAKIEIDYPGLGYRQMSFRLPEDSLEPIFEWRSQGFPLWLYWPSKMASKIGMFGWRLWPTHEKVTWAQDVRNEDGSLNSELALERWVLHRFLDLLGALSLVDHQGLLAGHIHSHMGGHKTDVGLIKKIEEVGLRSVS